MGCCRSSEGSDDMTRLVDDTAAKIANRTEKITAKDRQTSVVFLAAQKEGRRKRGNHGAGEGAARGRRGGILSLASGSIESSSIS